MYRLMDSDSFYEVCPYCYNRCARWLWEKNDGKCEHCQAVTSDPRGIVMEVIGSSNG